MQVMYQGRAFSGVLIAMKVTFITTLNHNVGDDFVRHGILHLLEHKLGPFTTANIHKHIPLTARPEAEWFYHQGISRLLDKMPRGKGLFWSRLLDALPLNPKTDKVLTCNLLVQSGAPVIWPRAYISEWYGPLIERRYKRIKNRVPFVNIGAGSCCSYYSDGEEILADRTTVSFIKELHEACALTTVRDSLSKRILNRLDLDAPIIPCPSIFAADSLRCCPQPPEYVVLNYMPNGGHFTFSQDIAEDKWQQTFVALYKALASRTSVLIVCHNDREYSHTALLLPAAMRFLGHSAEEYLRVYSRARCYIGNRVHGAYAVASFGRPALVIGSDSRAHMMSEIGLSSIYVNNADLDSLVAEYESMIGEMANFSKRMTIVKQAAFASYMKALDILPLSASQ